MQLFAAGDGIEHDLRHRGAKYGLCWASASMAGSICATASDFRI
jgi:hypothetical protein